MVARSPWLRTERDFWRESEVLCSIPEGYDSEESDEIWDDDSPSEILDANRIGNYDEVPFQVNWKTRQLILKDGERVSLTQQAVKRLKKYREGSSFCANQCQPMPTNGNQCQPTPTHCP